MADPETGTGSMMCSKESSYWADRLPVARTSAPCPCRWIDWIMREQLRPPGPWEGLRSLRRNSSPDRKKDPFELLQAAGMGELQMDVPLRSHHILLAEFCFPETEIEEVLSVSSHCRNTL